MNEQRPVRGCFPSRFLTPEEVADYADEPSHHVYLPLGFEGQAFRVFGHGLCAADACEAVVDALREENPDYTSDWEELEESLMIR